MGPVTPASRGALTQRPLTPPPGKFSCSEPQSKTKGCGEEGAAEAQSPLPRSPPAALRPARRWPRTKAWAAPRPLVSPRAARDRSRRSRRGATRDGKTRWLRPSSRSLHPSLRVPAAWPPSAGARGGLGPGSAGSPRGKDCLCLKVTTRARCPGWAWCLPVPGRGGGDGGPPQSSGGDRGKAHFPPPTTALPVTAPSGTSQRAGEGVNSFRCWGVGDQVNSFHCLGAVGRGRPSGLLPHPSPPPACQNPVSPRHPRE